MIIINFYKSNRKNAKSLKRFSFDYNNYTELNYIYTVLSYIVEFKPKFYTIDTFKVFNNPFGCNEFRYSTGYRHYKKIYDIESVINNLVAFVGNEKNYIPDELYKIHHATITRQLINKYYHN